MDGTTNLQGYKRGSILVQKWSIMRKLLFILMMSMVWVMNAQESCRVIRVVDGDTFELLCLSGKKMTRLMNVDAPETDQYYGMVVTDSLKAMMEGDIVAVEQSKRDFYGRHLVKIRWEDKRLDSLLIAKGWAWHYHAFSDDVSLADVQDHAKEQAQGMWQCGYNVPPWIWRSMNKRNKRLYRLCR